jgi:DNA-binding Lrp family transcriptional regulator
MAFIKLAKYARAVIERFLSRVEAIHEVRRVFLVSGRHDVIVHVVVKDIDHLRNQPEVVNIETSIVFDSRSRNELPILKDDVEPTKASARSKKTPRR